MAMANDTVVTAAQIAVEQCWQDPEALGRNTDKVLARYAEVADHSDLVVFPELALSGYIPLKGYDQRRKRLLAEIAHRAFEEALPRLRAATAGRRAALALGTPEPSTMRNELYNSVAYLQDGEVLGLYRKLHLPVEENHYFVPGDGPVVVDAAVGRVALSICYDMLFPEMGRVVALQGAELMLVPSNWLDIANLRRYGEILPAARAIEGQLHVMFVNGVGQLEVRGRQWSLYGRSRVVAATGETVAVAGPDEELLSAKLTAADLDAGSDVFPLLRDRRPQLYAPVVAPLTSFAGPTGS